MFCSGFDANGFVLATSDGVKSLGLITGSSVCHVDHTWQGIGLDRERTYNRGEEIAAVTQAQSQAWRLALARLQNIAHQRQAHGVLNVRFERNQLGPNVEEVRAWGTAVVLDRPPLPPTPFLCSLTSQEFWTLRRGGYRPVGLAVGACTRFCVPHYETRRFLRGNTFVGMKRFLRGEALLGQSTSREIADYTKVVAAARDTALARLITSVRGGLAEGVIGITLEEWSKGYIRDNRDCVDLLISVTATGTAITPHRDRWPVIDYALPLDG